MPKKRIVVVLLVFLTLLPKVDVSASSQLEIFDKKSDEALQLAKLQRYEDSLAVLQSYSDGSVGKIAKQAGLSKEVQEVVDAAYVQAVESLQNNNVEMDGKVTSLTRLRLAADAAHSVRHPLWTEMEGEMMETFNQAKQALDEKNKQQFNQSLNSLMLQYSLIYDGMKVNLNKETIQSLDQQFAYLDAFRPQLLKQAPNQKELSTLQYDMKTIFDKMKEDDADPSLWWVIFTTGGIIISTLSYVGWRKYKGTKEKVKGENDLND
ncbi:sporulation protein YpjB [Bacillus sp. 1P06AnD]|uniref:sporulation protein YpjB n=1 Tax=Bacillus sp. 1P06AnD TaxID=3132208 RepID=UPI0039A2EBD5